MYLEKWYADSVENGQVQIRYLANLHLGPITIGYSGGLQDGRSTTTRVGIRGIALPSVVDNVVHWPTNDSAEALAWTGAVVRSEELAREDDRAITWSPIVLNGRLRINECQRPAGGYVERLTLGIAPWRLGLKRLKWGRFCGKAHSLVWIEWEGEIPKKLSLLDGENDSLLEVTQRRVRTQRAELTMENPNEIVSEPIGSGALKAAGLIKMFSARQFLSGIETKWLAQSSLSISGQDVDSGYAVYEEVVWL